MENVTKSLILLSSGTFSLKEGIDKKMLRTNPKSVLLKTKISIRALVSQWSVKMRIRKANLVRQRKFSIMKQGRTFVEKMRTTSSQLIECIWSILFYCIVFAKTMRRLFAEGFDTKHLKWVSKRTCFGKMFWNKLLRKQNLTTTRYTAVLVKCGTTFPSRLRRFFFQVSSSEEQSNVSLIPSANFSDWKTSPRIRVILHEYGKQDWTNG